MFIFLLIHSILASQTKNPPLQVKTSQNNTNDYTISTQDFYHLQQTLKQYPRYTNAYDLQMYVQSGIQNYSNLSAFQKITENQLLHQGCTFDQRRIKVEQSISLQLPDDNAFIYTDVEVVGNISYLVRNDNKLFLVDLAKDQLRLQSFIIDFNDLLAFDLNKMPLLFADAQTVFVITEIGAVSYDGVDKKFHVLEKMGILKSIHYDSASQHLFIVSEGVQCYSLKDRILTYKYTIRIELNILKVESRDNQVFLLDNKVGIHFVTIRENDYEIENFQLPVENALSFELQKNSFLVIAETDQKISFAVEILIDFSTKDYYYNRFYLEDMQLRDVQSCGNFQYLIGFDVHKIVQTNIFRGFVDEAFDYDSDFMLPLLEKVRGVYSVAKQNYQQHFIVSLTPQSLNILIVKDHQPEIICESQRQLQQTYIVEVNSTNCLEANSSPYTVCQELHHFHLKVNEVLLDSQQELGAEIFLICVGSIFVFLVICGICMCRKWRLIMFNMQMQMQQQETKKKYSSLQLQ